MTTVAIIVLELGKGLTATHLVMFAGGVDIE